MPPTDADFTNYWDPEYLFAFQLLFQTTTKPAAALLPALQHVPPAMARVEFADEFAGHRLVVLFTHNVDNDGARLHEALLLTHLAETRAVTAFGVEGSVGQFDLEKFRGGPNRNVRETMAAFFLQSHLIYPVEYMGMAATPLVPMYGIDDRELYLAAFGAYKRNDPAYFDAIRRRPAAMVSNILHMMTTYRVDVVGVWLSDYNFHEVHQRLSSLGISNVGIRSRDHGPSDHGRMDRVLRGKPVDQNDALLRALFTDPGRGKLVRAARAVGRWVRLLFAVGRPRAARYEVQVAGPAMTIQISETNPFERWLGWLPRLLSRVGELFRRPPNRTSEMAVRLGHALGESTCDECGKAVRSSAVAIAVPMDMTGVEFDLGGQCPVCRRAYCPAHAQCVGLRIRGQFVRLMGCPACNEPLATPA